MNRNHIILSLFGILACFVANSVTREAIISGFPADPNQFLYYVSLQVDHNHTCGGGILDHLHIITAAHCVLSQHNNFRGGHMSIVAGTINLNNHRNERIVRREVAKIYLPAEFNPMEINITGDIAVLRLKHSLEFKKNQHLETMKVAHTDSSYHGHIGTVAGFGWNKIDGNGGSSDFHLRWAGADVLDRSQCKFSPHDHSLTEKQLCVKLRENHNTHRGVCTGDDGSPLVINGIIVGIVSLLPWGCIEKPAIYTRVYSYNAFILYATHDVNRDDIRTLVLH